MRRYAVMLDLEDRPVVVVGGGAVAERKAEGLAAARARVTVVSPDATSRLARQAEQGAIAWRPRAYAPGDLAGAALAFAATDRRDVNAAVRAEARAAGIPCNVADDPEASDFFVPSVVRRGDLLLAVSTGGASPMVARRVREALEGQFGPEWAPYLALLAAARRAALALGEGPERNRALLADLADLDLLPRIAAGAWQDVERAVAAAAERHLGRPAASRFTLEALGVGP